MASATVASVPVPVPLAVLLRRRWWRRRRRRRRLSELKRRAAESTRKQPSTVVAKTEHGSRGADRASSCHGLGQRNDAEAWLGGFRVVSSYCNLFCKKLIKIVLKCRNIILNGMSWQRRVRPAWECAARKYRAACACTARQRVPRHGALPPPPNAPNGPRLGPGGGPIGAPWLPRGHRCCCR